MGKTMQRLIKQGLMAFLLMVITIVGVNAVMSHATVSAQAAVKSKTYKTVPKSLQGTWYHYDKGHGLYKITVRKSSLSYGYKKQYTMHNLLVIKYYAKHKTSFYNISSKSNIGPGINLFSYTMKINGKKRHVLAEPSQGAGIRLFVYTSFKTSHVYTAPASLQKHLA
ncbi:hypothetical protein IWT5_00666 [Secundilactobacillus silagincola]|uniref:Uncharacterized protein n=1 Tax=Secundilactobacillus silagincola TaxID=1714681 RepID=A0A1Z5H5E7_9LACO|nr:hypothetical protein [Secundilactobacillus silagincola]GAT18392.1 hypothetical protein IWT5_00666 [Secundilactobacillus silagincola]